MDQLSNFISEYLKTCETIKKLNSKTIKAYRIDLSQFHTFMLPQEDFAYSARTAYPFQRNGAPFRFKLSKAQQVD